MPGKLLLDALVPSRWTQVCRLAEHTLGHFTDALGGFHLRGILIFFLSFFLFWQILMYETHEMKNPPDQTAESG